MDTRQQHNPKVSTDEWYTPRWIIDELGPFDLDPCAPAADVRPFEIAPVCYTKDDDGLARDWNGTVWLNPPYSREPLRRFCEKIAAHGDGIALLVNRQDNLLWQEVIFPTAASMIFMRHRVKFIQPDGRHSSPFFGSCLVAWGYECDRRLRCCSIEGKYVVLNGTYTGLHDRKDREIYEGDILCVEFSDKSGGKYLVGWNDKTASWGLMDRYEYQSIHEGYDFAEFKNHTLLAFLKEAIVCEVVGNIHGRPELMDVQKY